MNLASEHYNLAFRYLFLSKLLKDAKERIDKCLTGFATNFKSQELESKLILPILAMETETLHQQVELISSISNNHHWSFPTLDGGSSQGGVRYSQHLLWHPSMEKDDGDLCSPSYFPSSPRHQLLFFWLNSTMSQPFRLKLVIRKCVLTDLGELGKRFPEPVDIVDEPENPPPKRRRYASRLVSVSVNQFGKHLEIDMSSVENVAPSRTLFEQYSENLAEGVVQFRHLSPGEAVVCLNDYCPDTGRFLPLSFVHLTVRIVEGGGFGFHCTCRTHKDLLACALGNISLREGEEPVLDDTFNCLHVRYYQKFLSNCFEDLRASTTTGVHRQVRDTLHLVHDPIVILGPCDVKGATKLSVKGQEEGDLAFVHITFQNKSCFARCMVGLCGSRNQNRKKIPRVQDVNEKLHCPHLNTLSAGIEILHDEFPGYFAVSEEGLLDEEGEESEEVNMENMDDIELRTVKDTISFDVDSSRWKSSSLCQHVPMQMDDPLLIEETGGRLLFMKKENLNMAGMYKGQDLCPIIQENNCPCGVRIFLL